MGPLVGGDTPTSLAAGLAAMQLLDSAAPTGAFAHSFGFETYMEEGAIDSPDSFAAWLHSYILNQLLYNDAIAIRLVYRAQSFEDVADLDRLLVALTLPSQIVKANQAMGKRLLRIAAANYGSAEATANENSSWLRAYDEQVGQGRLTGHPAIAWAVVACQLGIPVEAAVSHFLYATAISLTQNAVRAVPLGQDAGQRVERRAQVWILEATERSRSLGLADLGATVPGLEIAQMRHERQRARLFMS